MKSSTGLLLLVTVLSGASAVPSLWSNTTVPAIGNTTDSQEPIVSEHPAFFTFDEPLPIIDPKPAVKVVSPPVIQQAVKVEQPQQSQPATAPATAPETASTEPQVPAVDPRYPDASDLKIDSGKSPLTADDATALQSHSDASVIQTPYALVVALLLSFLA